MMFSVIVPAYNSEQYIRKGLESIRQQSFKDYELIVVCDRCTDNTEQIAKEYGAITESVNFGKDGLTRDKGLSMAKGDWILFMDDDDWFIHEFCFQQLRREILACNDMVDVLAFGYVAKGMGYYEPSEYTIFRPGDAHVWSNCWRRSATTGASFGDAVFCSDTYFVRDMKKRVRRYELFNMPIYYYNFKRLGSQTDLLIQGKIRQSPVAR